MLSVVGLAWGLRPSLRPRRPVRLIFDYDVAMCHTSVPLLFLIPLAGCLLLAQSTSPSESTPPLAQAHPPSRISAEVLDPRLERADAIEKRVQGLLSQMTLEEKIDFIGGDGMYTRAVPRLGIKPLKMSDGPLGVRTWGPTTAYPAGIAMAASWDVALVKRIGTMMGADARARGVNFLLGPGMNIYRAPMCGRNFEYFGEDPYLASRIAVADIEGIQSQGVVATAKHFAGNNQEWDRHNVSSDIDERTLREIYLPAFEAAVKEAKVGALMNSYNLLNGVHTSQNSFLDNTVAKADWGFSGIIMSDWTSTYDGVASANAGLDLEMPTGAHMNRETLLPAIRAGKVSAATIDDKVRRILRTAIEFGFFDRDQTDKQIPLDNPAARAVALEAARGSMVLLKNDGKLLPLNNAKLKTIAVIGPNADRPVTGGGGSSIVKPFRAVSFLEGIKAAAGPRVDVVYSPGLALASASSRTTAFFADPALTQPGLKTEYFHNPDLSGAPASSELLRPPFSLSLEPAKLENGSFEGRSERLSGYFVPPVPGQYEIEATGDNSYEIYFEGKALIEGPGDGPGNLVARTPLLLAGQRYEVHIDVHAETRRANLAFGLTSLADTTALDRAKDVANKADAVILCVGFDAANEGEGFDRTFQLPASQDALINAILSVNKNTVVVLTAGGAVDMTQWIDNTPVLLDTWYPGEEGGTALAQLLFGEYSPSGKLPASFERRWDDNATANSYYDKDGSKHVEYSEGVFLGYRHFDRVRTKPLFPFGYGLSYTTFEYRNLRVTPTNGSTAMAITVSFQLTNTGSREGAEVAQLYVGDRHSHVARPVKELKGFAKVNLKPGESRTIELTLDRHAFSYYDVAGKQWKAEPGDFDILVTGSSADRALAGKFTLEQ